MIRGISWWQLGITVLGIYMLVAGLKGTGDWIRARRRLSDASARLLKIQEENTKLKGEWEKVDNPAYVERVARDELGMQLPGETVVIVRQETEKREEIGKKDKNDESVQNWEKWTRLLRL